MLLLLFLLCVSSAAAQGVCAGQKPVACTNPGTGTATQCCVVNNILGNGPGGDRFLCPGLLSHGDSRPTSEPVDCWCPADTCVATVGDNPYSGLYLQDYPYCKTANGAGWWYDDNPPSQTSPHYYYCTLPVRGLLCIYGDLTTNYNGGHPYLPFSLTSSSDCTCDCGYGADDNGIVGCIRAGAGSTASCANPLTGALVNFQTVKNPYQTNGICTDLSGLTVKCFCPSDTCATYASGSSTYPQCLVIGGAGVTGYGWNTTLANNHAFVFCTQTYRNAICNGFGDVPTGTMFVAPNAPISSPCTCDCGYVDTVVGGVTHRCAGTNFITPVCVNPSTNNTVPFAISLNPQTNGSFCLDNHNNQVFCLCPQDTCTVLFDGFSVCKNGWTGFGWNTTTANAHEYLQCGESYRVNVCNNRGIQPTPILAYSPLAAVTNPPGPCTCDLQWWDTTYSDGRVTRCNFQSNCSISTRFGFDNTHPCGGHGTCQRNSSCICQSGWGGPACDQNLKCPSASPNLECSGFGTCEEYLTPFNVMTYGVWTDLSGPGFNPLIPNNFTFGNAPVFALCFAGADFLFQASGFGAFGEVLAVNCSTHDVVLVNACLSGQLTGGPMGCYRSVLSILFTGNFGAMWQRYLTTTGYATNMVQFVQDAFKFYYPPLVSIDASWISPMVAFLTSSNPQLQAEGLALLLSYTSFVDFTNANNGYPAPYPSFPQYVCRCNGGAVPALLSPSGKDCSKLCPYNPLHFGLACGGTDHGVVAGQCVTSTSTCVCNPGFTTVVGPSDPITACNFDMVDFCIPQTGGPVCSTSQFQSEVQGTCFTELVNGPYGPTAVGSCDCTPGWNGQFCSNSVCTNTTVECGNNGACNGATRLCVCAAIKNGVNQLITNPPPLWAGKNCSFNAITQCGHFVTINQGQGTGVFKTCNNAGICKQNTTAHGRPFACFCTGLNFGSQCQFTGCNPACNTSNSFCNVASGTCSCQTMWSGPTCSVNLCVNGHPNSLGTACVCNKFWTAGSGGVCNVAQCPFVANTIYSGIRACNYTTGDLNCGGSSGGTIGCCYNGCPTQCAVSGGVPVCTCLPTAFFTQSNGICFPKCHGGTVISSNPFTCSCTNVLTFIDSHTQFIDGFCNVFTCANGGTAHSGGCTCPATWTGATCTTNACQHGGTPGPNAVCVCANGYSGTTCATQINPNPPDPSSTGSIRSSSSSTGSTPISSTASIHSSSSTGHISSSTGIVRSSSSSTATSFSSSSSSSAQAMSAATGLSSGAIIGIAAAGGAVVLTGVALLIVYAVKPALLTSSTAISKGAPIVKYQSVA